MAKKDAVTFELPGVPRRRGRPSAVKLLSPVAEAERLKLRAAERQRKRRERLAAEGQVSLTVNVPQELVKRIESYVFERGGDVTKDDLVKKALEAFFRKR